MKLPRFRIRTMMVVVATVALIIAGGIMIQRAWRYKNQANYHAAAERKNWDTVKRIELLARAANNPETLRGTARDAAYEAEIAKYHAGMKAKYLRAASRPWEAVPPDPSPP